MSKVRSAQEMMTDNLIVKHYAGSKAYGTALPTSDTDFRGVFVADQVNVRTPFYRVEEVEDTKEEDTKIYELGQFVKLVVDCNPNVIETLWVDRDDLVHTTPAYELLREAAPKLLSSKIAFTTSGYALSQLKRIKGHNKFVNNPQPEQPPKQIEFVSLVHNFTPEKMFKIDITRFRDNHRLVPYSGDVYGVYQMNGFQTFNPETFTLNTAYDGDSHKLDTPLYVVKFNKQVYNEAKEKWAQYWDWKTPKDKKAKLFGRLEQELQKRNLHKEQESK